MKRSIMGAAILMLGLALGTGQSGEAEAFAGGVLLADGGRGSDSAIQQVHFKKKHHKHHHKHRNKHRNHRKGGVFITLGNVFGGQHYNNGWQPSAHKDCHGVIKDGYFHGRYAKIGGTMCYDHRGRGYIVDGSRHLIHYY